ncbi:hypothetical protein DFH08DRAFT_956279 [Mycena albidolilacea]|uniref:Uncharacterized protein n=1 Tax=Mycena albidolilacea TaxID=1033008 RepID=A0AAD7EUR7_9AGAR|nr:hypothetical protein DFH08DRAFT_956279 [Mycena albidolilacea]
MKPRPWDLPAVTPSPKKTRLPVSYPALKSLHSISAPASTSSLKKQPEEFVPVKPVASTLLSKLAHVNRQPFDKVEPEPLVRSSDFTDTLRDPSISSSTAPQSRVVPHEDIQDHLRGRYYLSPSRLYSVIRLLPDKQGYDVPVAGDWITIAVVAERGPYKYSKALVEITPDEDNHKGKTKAPPKPSGKKFINIKLVDFGAPARSASSATGGKTEEGRPKKVYRGGSHGTFEQMCDLKATWVHCSTPGFSSYFRFWSNDTPHPATNILAITPESASSILVIRRAKDLGLCIAVKRDGKWGLKPLEESSGATYLVSGHIIHAGRVDPWDSLFVSENISREGQAKAARKLAAREDAQILKVLQDMKAVMKVREVGLGEKEKEKLRSSTKGKQKQKSDAGEASATATPDASAPKVMTVKSAFSTQALKHLGFDPTIKPGQVRHNNSATKKKMEDLAALQASRGPITLKSRAGEKVRSGVVVPSTLQAKTKKKPVDLTHARRLGRGHGDARICAAVIAEN